MVVRKKKKRPLAGAEAKGKKSWLDDPARRLAVGAARQKATKTVTNTE